VDTGDPLRTPPTPSGAVHPYDLQARAALATYGLTGLLDPDRDGLQYFVADWRARPPRADHTLWDFGDGSGRHLDALTLTRTMVPRGSVEAEPGAADEQIEAWVLWQLGEHGLSWLPDESFAQPWGAGALLVDPRPGDTYCEVSWSQRGTLMGLLARFQRTGDERYLAHARGVVDGLAAIAETHRDGSYFPEGYYRRGGWLRHRHDLHPCLVEYNAAVVPVLVRMYEVSRYAPALDLAVRLTDFALRHTEGYDPDGRLVVPAGDLGSHFHTRSNFVLGVLKLGIVQGRSSHIAWARSGYHQLQRHGTEFGWFPEGIGLRHGELCCTTDMIEIALLLGRTVDRRYYADAERYGRNQLLQSQWSSVERLVAGVGKLPASSPHEIDPAVSTDTDVALRQHGAFASRPALNDGFHLDVTAMMQCCNAAGARGVYDLWHHAAVAEPRAGGTPRVGIHLRFSVETEHVRVICHEPTRGRLDIAARHGVEVEVRLPEGTPRAVLTRTPVGSAGRSEISDIELTAVDGYVHVPVRAGEDVTLTYHQRERVAASTVGKPGRDDQVTGFWRGETLVRVEPEGRFHPLHDLPADLAPVTPSPPAHTPLPSL
jgi:hypothetical protein